MTERTGRSRLLGNRYEIGEVLGYGGMAEVFRGRDIRLSRDVAVKVLRSDLARDPSFQNRFRREAQAAASLNHPAIVSVYDTGEELEPDNGGGAQVAVPYIVMEYVEGRTLRDVMQREGRLTVERSLEIVGDICEALEYSHRAGIIHRDIKPGNVMLTRDGVVKVMDFGIARAVTASSATMTQTAAVIGTAQYLSPEQARGETVDARSDVYSTGILLYELLTGVPPFRGDSPVAVAYQHVREDPRPPSLLDPDIPRDVDAIVMKSLAKNPDNRYGSAAEMREDLLRAIDGRPVYATPVMAEDERTAMLGAAPPPLMPAEPQRSRRNLTWLFVIIGALIVFAIAAVLATSLLGGSSKVTVPTVNNLTEQAARLAIVDAGLTVGTVAHQNSASVASGRIITSDPAQGSKVGKNSAVSLVVSSGIAQVRVPPVKGLSQADAESSLTQAGLQVGTPVQFTGPSTSPPGTVLSADPGSGTMVARNTKVSLTVVSATVPVPDVSNKSESAATTLLESYGFTVNTQTRNSTSADSGTVLQQSPAPGSTQNRSATVTIVVAQHVTPTTPPPTTAPPTTAPPTSAAPTTSPSAQASASGTPQA